jgi:hypothetical protein
MFVLLMIAIGSEKIQYPISEKPIIRIQYPLKAKYPILMKTNVSRFYES